MYNNNLKFALSSTRKFYVIGGIGVDHLEQLICGEEFDLKTRKWREIPNMFPRAEGAARRSTTEAPPLVAVVNNSLYLADYALLEVRRYDKGKNSWVTIGRLPEGASSMNGWGLVFRACGDRLIVIGGPTCYGVGAIDINACVPGERAVQWNLLARRQSGTFVYNCVVMGC
ncbi:F-box/kelch-repeat protein SKIP11-like [Gastrolobium bilobum]|uniref:F-box/kelch-repeat protein SKIP11-like n=1 Tax=Gastrolobium bilobum TaxID=150636 RepID=UPI002AAF8E13|nr:F-box/kelch-repeat protein SKIP11-like [Gastrolobium bilobum]